MLSPFLFHIQPPVGICQFPCQPGSRIVNKEGLPSCCFECTACPEGSITNATGNYTLCMYIMSVHKVTFMLVLFDLLLNHIILVNDRDDSAYSSERCLLTRAYYVCILTRSKRIPGLGH